MDEAYPGRSKAWVPRSCAFSWVTSLRISWRCHRPLGRDQQIFAHPAALLHQRAEAAANQYSFLASLRHTISQWYLTHIESIDRGTGRPTAADTRYAASSLENQRAGKSSPGGAVQSQSRRGPFPDRLACVSFGIPSIATIVLPRAITS